ncbi:hypothetical protein [Tunicatimonas pelagia]|uniref:hypothetical protein n=1 Tax=Tunicatimonas pelagia TaxID=931531 RepID=UPI00266677A0|nr:hypothetical protein [Tunicatimonas pelagia]WKN46115.1 hypothetical protein P0M28_14265 [Tunicatimonas pelagia]
MVKIEKELRQAIIEMPEKEKDKLLLRLIAKDLNLLNQLQFKLLEGEGATQERKEEVKDYIQRKAEYYPAYYYSPGYLMMEMRDCSGTINEYRSITKDKIGEIELQLDMLISLLKPNMKKLTSAPPRKMLKFTPYVVKRAGKIIGMIEKLHEDYHLEFMDDLKRLGELIKQLDPEMKVARINDVDIQLLYDS